MIASAGTFQSDGTDIHTTSNSWGNITVQSVATEPVLQSSTNYSYGINGGANGQLIKTTATIYSDYDSANGQPHNVNVNVTTPDGQNFENDTTTAFDNNVDTGCIGMPNQVTVTRMGMNQADPTESRVVTYDNDLTHCRVNSVTQEDADDLALKLTQAYSYDDAGNVAKVTVTGGILSGGARVTEYGYDYSDTFLQTITQHVGSRSLVTHQQWDSGFGLRTSVTAPNGAVTTWNYDGLGRVTTNTLPTGVKETVSYMYCGGYCDASTAAYHIKTEIKDPDDNLGGRTLVEVDDLGRTVAVKKVSLGGQFAEVLTEYDARGNKHKVSAPFFVGDTVYWNTSTYDLLGRVTTVIDGAGHETDFDYEGLQEKVTVGVGSPDQRQTTYQFDALGERTQVIDAAGHTFIYAYTPFDARQSITDFAGNVTTYHYNTRGFLTELDDPDRHTQTFTYDAAGDPLTATDAQGEKITQTYDPLGRVATRSMPGARGGTDTATWTYDTATNGNGLLASITKSEGDGDSYIQTYSYNSSGEPTDITQIVQAVPVVISRTYDGFGRLATITYPDVSVLSGGSGGGNTRFSVGYAYDWSGELLKAYDAHNPSTVFWHADSTDAMGHLTQATLGNGLIAGRTYDPITGALDEIKVGPSGESTSVSWFQYQYDTLGEVAERTSPNDGLEQDFTYTNLGQLSTQTLYQNGTQTQQMTYHYDAIGNIHTRPAVGTYTYGENGAGPHAVTSISGAHNAIFAYNADGEMTMGNGRGYAWDALGRVTQVAEGLATTDVWYTPAGGRYREVLSDGLTGVTTTIYALDPYFRMVRQGGSWAFQNEVLIGGRAVATVWTTPSGATSGKTYFHYDGLGSVVATTSGQGAVRAYSAYGVWGRRVNPATWKGTAPDDGTLADTRRGYTDHEQLPEVGLVHMDGRVYDPDIGRFVSADPVLQSPFSPQDLNGYSYVMNSPLTYTDPTGYDIFGDLIDPLGILGGAGDALGDLLGGVGDAIEHIGQEVKTYWKPIVAIGLAVFTAGMAAPAVAAWLAASMAVTSTTAFAALSAVVTGAVAGGIFGAALTALNGGSMGDMLRAGLKGAAIGGLAGGLTYGAGAVSANWGFFGQAAAHGVAGGLTGVAAGGSFQKGFELAMLAYGAYSLYQYLNPYRQGPCWFSGEKGWRYKPENPVGTSYDNEDYNNWGRAVLTGKTPGLFSEGGPISRAMMYLGGQNAVGTFHDWLGDVMQINGMSQSVYYAFMSIPTMLPAAAFTYAGLINTPIGYGLIASDRYDNSYW